MDVIYTIDREKDMSMVYTMLKSDDLSDNLQRTKRMGISRQLFNKIAESSSYNEVENEINELYNTKLLNDKELLLSKTKLYQSNWNLINDIFEEETERVVGMKWKYEKYYVIVSLFHPGVSNMLGDTVYLWIYDDLDIHLRIAAHELLMTHLWQFFYKNFPEEDINNNWNKYWSVNEITTTFILGLDSKLNNLWSDRMKGYKNFLQNYPQLKEGRDLLVNKYKKRSSFKDFIDYSLPMFTTPRI